MQFDKLQDIIQFAIDKEQEASDFYLDLARRVKSDDIAAELGKMAIIEERHKKMLQDMPFAFVADGGAPPVTDMKLADYIVETPVSEDMSFQDIVNVAMHRELASMNLYASLAKIITDPTAKKVFENLASQEQAHKNYFETIWDDNVMIEN